MVQFVSQLSKPDAATTGGGSGFAARAGAGVWGVVGEAGVEMVVAGKGDDAWDAGKVLLAVGAATLLGAYRGASNLGLRVAGRLGSVRFDSS